MVTVRKYTAADLPDMIRIWNQVVEDGIAFPQENLLDAASGAEFFAAQSYNGVAALENGFSLPTMGETVVSISARIR